MDINKPGIYKGIIIFLILLIFCQISILFTPRENFQIAVNGSKCLEGNCDSVWPVYHRNGVDPTSSVWSCQSPRTVLKSNTMACGENLSNSPVGIESKLTQSYDWELPENAIYDNILDIPIAPYDKAVSYLSPIASSGLVKPGCDCSTKIAKMNNIE